MENATGLSVLTAAGIGQGFFALGMAWAVASGGSFLGWRAPRSQRVLHVDGELAELRERLALVRWRL